MKNKILLVALGTMATSSITYGSQYSELQMPRRPQTDRPQEQQFNYPELQGWQAAPQAGPAQQNYYNLHNAYVQPVAAGQQPHFVPPRFEQFPALAQIMQQPEQETVRPTAPLMDDETAAQVVQQQAAAVATHAKREKPHHDDVIKHQAFLPVEMAAGYGMGLLMSDEILGLLQKVGFKKDAKGDLEKLKKRRAWYIPALILAGYLAHRFGPRSEVKKFVECACDQRGFHEVTRISIFDRLSNAAIGCLIGLIMPHLESQKSDSKTNTEQQAHAKSRSSS